MNRNRLTIGSSLHIYFDEYRKARHSPTTKSLESVTKELLEWQEFVQRWLDEVEAPRLLRRRTKEEKRLVDALTSMVTCYKRNKFPVELIKASVTVSATVLRDFWNAPTQEQKEAIVDEITSNL